MLVVQVHRQALAVARARVDDLLAQEHEAHSGNAFEAFAACRHQRVEVDLACVDRQRAKARHRVDDQPLATALTHLRDLKQRVFHAGAGFAVDHHHMRDRGIGLQVRVERCRRNGSVFGKWQNACAPAHHLRQLRGAFAIRAVVEYEHVAVSGNDGRDRRLDAEGAAALQRNKHMAALAVDHVEQLRTQRRGDGVELGVPGSPVLQHRELGSQRRRQRPGGEEDAVTVHGRSL